MASFWLDPATQKRYAENRAFSYGDINYTRQGANSETFSSLGFVPVYVQQRPSDKYYIVSGPNADGSYNATPRDLDQLKESLIEESRTTAGQLLTPTDWYYARQSELGDPGRVPAEVANFRAAVRVVHEDRKTAINACADVDELQALMNEPATISVVTQEYTPAVIDEETEEVVTPEIPEVREDQVNPEALPAWPEKADEAGEVTCDYRGFYDALLLSAVYQTIRNQAISTPAVTVACTEFVAAMADAKNAQVNTAALQATIDLLMAAVTLTTEERAELEAVMAAYSLDVLYTLPAAV